MTKHEALNDLAAVVRDTPIQLPRLESGPAPLTPRQRYVTSNPRPAQGSGTSSLFSQLAPLLTGLTAGGSGGSLLGTLLGSRQAGSQGAAGTGVGSLLSTSQGGGFGGAAAVGLSPILSGLLGLFGGSGKSVPAPIPLYSAPLRMQVQSGLQGGVVSGADSNQSGMARANGTSGTPQVTLHIQAMDTQSILNRSTDIAQAVRQAMLQSHPINDVVADL